MRLDRYLFQENLATAEQVQEAVDYQRTFGDRLESHLFRLGYVTEEALVAALAEQLNYPGVSLTDLEIPQGVLDRLPAEIAWTKLVVPFDYDPALRTLGVACEEPGQSLESELAALFPEYRIKLFVALSPVLRSAIVKNYRFGPGPVGNASPSEASDPQDADSEAAADSVPVPAEDREQSAAELPELAVLTGMARGKPDPTRPTCRLFLLDRSQQVHHTLTTILKYQGYVVTASRSVDEFARAALESRPDIQILIVPGDKVTVVEVLSQLAFSDVSVSEIPTFLVTSGLESDVMSELLKIGFEDIIRSESILDLLMIKLGRVRERLLTERSQRRQLLQNLGTHGSLEDMGIIDLLQAMGSTNKNISISVTGQGRQLTIYLSEGQIVFADCDGILGPEAVYQALNWHKGVWSVDSVGPEEFPEPNCHLTNEAILLEGCRRLDEASRSAPSDRADDPTFVFDPIE